MEGNGIAVGRSDYICTPIGKDEPVTDKRFIECVTIIEPLAQGRVEQERLEC